MYLQDIFGAEKAWTERRLLTLNREVKRILIDCKKRAVEPDLRRFENLSSENSVKEPFGFLGETLKLYHLICFDRAKKTSGPSSMQFQLHYETLLKERNVFGADLKELILDEAPDKLLNNPKNAEIKLGIKSLSSGKAPRQSKITADLLKALQD